MSDKTMLINAIHSEEIRIAVLEDKQLKELEIESSIGKKLKGNIYKATISRIEPSLQAAFVDIGSVRNAFIQINDIAPKYYPKGKLDKKTKIEKILSAGDELLVQVVKEERGLKGATLTTYLSLPGRYLILMPIVGRSGISRKIGGKNRLRIKSLIDKLKVPKGISTIIRTAGIDRSIDELERDMEIQLKVWEQIQEDEKNEKVTPNLLYKDSNVATRCIREYFTPDIREIIIDNKETFADAKKFIDKTMPRYRSRLKAYENSEPMFTHFGIDEQVATTMESTVTLKSGGEIVIDSLEALVAIDVNSGKATRGKSIEETAYLTNLEAAEEVAKQIRLRDIGGLIIIDFIDMTNAANRSSLEKAMQSFIKTDRAKIEICKLSKFGLLEMSRQRLKSSLSSQHSVKCQHCRGTGRIKSAEVVALEALRKIQAVISVSEISTIKTWVTPNVALILLNMKKAELVKLEEVSDAKILILSDQRLRQDEIKFQIEEIEAEEEFLEEKKDIISDEEE